MEAAGVAMSTATGPVSVFRKLFASLPVGLWIPLLGTAWAFLNVLLLILGARDLSRPNPVFSLLAGAIHGGIFWSIAIATVCAKMHAGTGGPPMRTAARTTLSNR